MQIIIIISPNFLSRDVMVGELRCQRIHLAKRKKKKKRITTNQHFFFL